MQEIFDKVFEKLSKMTDKVLREKMDAVADHPLTIFFENALDLKFGGILFSLRTRDLEELVRVESMSYHEFNHSTTISAANDQNFLVAA